MRNSTFVVGLTVACVVAGTPVWAARMRVHEMAESQDYGQKAGGMIGRGVVNAVTFWVDPLVGTVDGSKAGPPLIGTLTGFARGLGCGALRLGSGAVDIVSFWGPGFNGFPVSDSYNDCLAVGASTRAESETEAAPSAGVSEPSDEVQAPPPASEPAPASETPTHRVWKK